MIFNKEIILQENISRPETKATCYIKDNCSSKKKRKKKKKESFWVLHS